jgi:hypothetical protein
MDLQATHFKELRVELQVLLTARKIYVRVNGSLYFGNLALLYKAECSLFVNIR